MLEDVTKKLKRKTQSEMEATPLYKLKACSKTESPCQLQDEIKD